MNWIKSKGFSKSKVDSAGNILISLTCTDQEIEQALEVLDNWRAIHKYPMQIFKNRLKRVSEKIDKDALTVQRLKRLPSILKKLQRRYHGKDPTMKLSQMQDIAGCRAVMSNIELAKKLYKESYIKGDIKHKKVNEKDYIAHPKEDGYRSIHLIYRYNSDKEGKQGYNGSLVEIQIRSKLQHLWATAIETVDFFTRQAIKSNEGQKKWVDFFRLVSSAFAMAEKTPFIPNTPTNKKELYSQIKQKEKALKVMKIMNGWTEAIKVFKQVCEHEPEVKYFLLELDIIGEKLNVIAYTSEQEDLAIKEYAKVEKRWRSKKEYDVVLVGADTTNDLQKAYPNYFVDTHDFLIELKKIIDKAE